MGIFGNIIGKSLGGVAGGIAGGFVGGKKGRKIGSKLGSDLGGTAGALLTPYKLGGKVKKTEPALVHKGEYVLPAHVKPTKAQMSAVAKGKRGKGGKKSLVSDKSIVMFA
jgi:uncharacterized protein YcfJ